MKVSLKWLKEYVDIVLPPGELAKKLTMAGVEVKGIQIIGGAWTNVSIGEVVALDVHPNADRLKLVTVDLKSRRVTVVTGAPNLKIGDKVPFADVGAELIDGHTGETVKLKPAKIRGITSEGMVCSEKELGISDDHQGIMILPSEAPVGVPLAEYLGDVILDLDITPNRPDCLSVIGIAREIAALTEQALRVPEINYKELEKPVESFASVEIVEPALCPRYCASVITGVKIAPSPHWLQQRLMAYGMRPINNIVDITNYVMLEYGQPLHAFDYRKIAGERVVVRRAKDKEVLTTLDETERTLNSDMLVIADADRAVAIAGIMGGLDTEVTEATTAILVESANFDRAILRRGIAKLGLKSEASLRFEKGLSHELPLPALRRATQLILEIAGGQAAKGIWDAYPGKTERNPISLTISEVKRLLGMDIKLNSIIKTLNLLGFECQKPEVSERILVTVPYWRTDVCGSVDLVEEVSRVIGYDKIPTTMLAAPVPARRLTPEFTVREKLRNIMLSCGFQEVLTYSLTNLDLLKKLSPDQRLIGPQPLRIANPMTREQECLRTTLRANLLATLAFNQKYGTGAFRLFEIGKVFIPREGDLPEEKEELCAILNGERLGLFWRQQSGLMDFFDAKGIVEGLLCWIGNEIKFDIANDKSLHPSKRSDVLVGNVRVGIIGEVHPKVAEAFELSGTTYLIEIDLKQISSSTVSLKKYEPLPRFPSIIRDIALVIDEKVTYKQVRDAIQKFPLVSRLALFDLYRGEQIPRGKKSLAFRIVYQSQTKTLTDEQVAQVQKQILDALHHEFGAVLRK